MRIESGSVRPARRVAATVAVVTALAGLVGCVPASPPVQPNAPEDFGRFFAQEVEWTACQGVFLCAEVDAPTDWMDATSEPITLALIREPAEEDSEGVVFVNPGGPGASGIDLVQSGWASPGLRSTLDVIGWDPRGVGHSTPVDCGSDEEKDEFLFGTFEAPYDTEEWIQELSEETRNFAGKCFEATGELLGHVDTVSTARDLELLRALMGGEKLNYFGYSYGTEIGAIYAELFPGSLGRMVLDGAVDPTVGPFEMLRVQYAGYESALRAYVEDCLARSGCPFTGAADSVLADIHALIGSVDGAGLVGEDGRVLDSATFATAVVLTLSSRSSWPEASRMFAQVERGGADLAFQLADLYRDRNPDGSYASNLAEGYIAVTCVDENFSADPATTLERIDELEATAPTIGRYLAFDDYAVLDVACTDWPVPPVAQPEEYDAEGAPPILVIGTTNDPATPYVWAESLVAQLSSGRLITFQGEGHTAYNLGNECIDSTVEDFLTRGVVPAEDPVCSS